MPAIGSRRRRRSLGLSRRRTVGPIAKTSGGGWTVKPWGVQRLT